MKTLADHSKYGTILKIYLEEVYMSAKLSVSEEKPVLKKFFCVNQYKEK